MKNQFSFLNFLFLDGFVLFKNPKEFMQVKSVEYVPIRQLLFNTILKFSKKMGEEKFEKNCIYTIKSQYINPENVGDGKINLALIMCFTDAVGEIKKNFETEFIKKYTEALNVSPMFQFSQRFHVDQSLNFKYFENELNN